MNTSTLAHELCLEICWVIEEVRRHSKAEGPDNGCGKKLSKKLKQLQPLIVVLPCPGLSPSLWCPPAVPGTRETSAFLSPL